MNQRIDILKDAYINPIEKSLLKDEVHHEESKISSQIVSRESSSPNLIIKKESIGSNIPTPEE